MPQPPIPGQLVEVLRKPNPAVMAAVRPDGMPTTVATWYVWDDESGRILLTLAAERKRLEYLRNDPRVSLTVLDGESWYRHVSVQGTVTLEDDPDKTDVDRVAQHYTQHPYPARDQARVSAWLDIEYYHSWGF